MFYLRTKIELQASMWKKAVPNPAQWGSLRHLIANVGRAVTISFVESHYQEILWPTLRAAKIALDLLKCVAIEPGGLRQLYVPNRQPAEPERSPFHRCLR